MPNPAHLLAELGEFGAAQRISLGDPAIRDAFGGHVSASLDAALSNGILLHGHRVEAMFEAMLVALGEYRLLKLEDAGHVYPADGFKVPDFRVVLADGEQWLIEVKNVYVEDPAAQRRQLMTPEYRAALEAYAAATGATLKLAVYWARWSFWTLVSPERFVDADGNVVLEMMEAYAANELGRLGDRSIATVAPLRLRFLTDPEHTTPIGPDGALTVAFSGGQYLSGDAVITDPIEKEIAGIFMEHGEWRCEGPEPIVEGDRLVAVEFRWEPEEPTGQGFEFVGSLSRMFSRYYAANTLKDDQVVQLRAPLRPSWFAPLIRHDHVSDALPLWRFNLQPTWQGRSDD